MAKGGWRAVRATTPLFVYLNFARMRAISCRSISNHSRKPWWASGWRASKILCHWCILASSRPISSNMATHSCTFTRFFICRYALRFFSQFSFVMAITTRRLNCEAIDGSRGESDLFQVGFEGPKRLLIPLPEPLKRSAGIPVRSPMQSTRGIKAARSMLPSGDGCGQERPRTAPNGHAL